MQKHYRILSLLLSVLFVYCYVVAAASATTIVGECDSDVNSDGVVNLFDLVAVTASYNPLAPASDPHCDVNQDGVVNLFDLVRVSRDYGLTCDGTCIGAVETWNHIGHYACVEFYVADTWNTGEQAFLNSHYPFEGHFYVYIHQDKFSCWPALPDIYFDGRWVRVGGEIDLYQRYNSPQIVLQECGDIKILQ